MAKVRQGCPKRIRQPPPGDHDLAHLDTEENTARADSSLERLNAALREDVLQAEMLPERSLTGLDERVRIDSLLSQAKRLLELGQLDQARQIALVAQDLGDTAQIDYSPDEDRPIDLVRRIEGQLEALRLKEGPRAKRDIVDSDVDLLPSDDSPFESNSTASQTSPAPEASGLARMRRDWSTLFRREKKNATTDKDPATKPLNLPQTPLPAEPRRQQQQANQNSDSKLNEAIVLANRSVSLGTRELDATSPVSLIAEAFDAVPREDDSASESSSLTDANFREGRELPLPDAINSERPSNDADEAALVPPEFDPIESVNSSNEIASSQSDRFRPQPPFREETPPDSDWTFFYIGCGFCSLLALGCYRRGAT